MYGWIIPSVVPGFQMDQLVHQCPTSPIFFENPSLHPLCFLVPPSTTREHRLPEVGLAVFSISNGPGQAGQQLEVQPCSESVICMLAPKDLLRQCIAHGVGECYSVGDSLAPVWAPVPEYSLHASHGPVHTFSLYYCQSVALMGTVHLCICPN